MPKTRCTECGKLTVRIEEILDIPLCSRCRSTLDKYAYVTKTRALQEFRLRPAELATLRMREVDNPHFKRAAGMQLFLLPQVRALAVHKWGNSEPYSVSLAQFTPEQIRALAEDIEGIKELSPERFEHLIANRLDRMGYGVHLLGGTRQRDGGVDIIAYPTHAAIPFLLAVQVKHHSGSRKTGAGAVRDFHGVLSSLHSPFSVGLLVTNTSYTYDAIWFAQHNSALLRLRDHHDLQRWLKEEFLNEAEWREIPEEVEVAPGVRIRIPRPRIFALNDPLPPNKDLQPTPAGPTLSRRG